MKEQIYQDFEKRKAEVLSRPEFKEKELSPEAEKQILREVVSEQIQKAQSTTVQQPSQNAGQIKSQPKERQVELLVALALDKSIFEAISVAKNLDSPYLIDELHDTIVDELYAKMVSEGKLKPI